MLNNLRAKENDFDIFNIKVNSITILLKTQIKNQYKLTKSIKT